MPKDQGKYRKQLGCGFEVLFSLPLTFPVNRAGSTLRLPCATYFPAELDEGQMSALPFVCGTQARPPAKRSEADGRGRRGRGDWRSEAWVKGGKENWKGIRIAQIYHVVHNYARFSRAGSGMPASSKPFFLKRQLSHSPQGRPSLPGL